MGRKFSELRAKMSPQAQRRAKARTQKMLHELRLSKLRRARELTQQQLASELDVNQAWISKVERQTDMYISTLRAYVEAAGGELQILAKFKDETFRIDKVEELTTTETTAKEQPIHKETAKESVISVEISTTVYQPSSKSAVPGIEIFSNTQTNTPSRTPDSKTPALSKAA